MIGSSNRFPHAAAVAVAEAPGKAYNPLLVYGDSGLGKTHLLHAIGHYVRSLYTGAKVRYVSSEEFTNEFINAIRDDRQDRLQAPLPRRRRAADRRHPVPGGQDPDPGGVLPHLQHPPQRQQADRAHLRPRAQAARGARGPAAQPVRVGPDHRRPAARPRDPDRDPAQEGRDGPAHRAAGRARVHRQQDPDQHPRARGCADPGHRVRQPQPPGGRHDPGRDRAQGPDPRGRRARDHRGADHRPDRGVLRALDRGAHRPEPRPAPGDGPPDRDVPLPRAHRPVAAQDRRAVRQPRPHDGDVRRPQDQPAARRAPRGVQPGQRADQPGQAAGPRRPDAGRRDYTRCKMWAAVWDAAGASSTAAVDTGVRRGRADRPAPQRTVRFAPRRSTPPVHTKSRADLRRAQFSTVSTVATTPTDLLHGSEILATTCAPALPGDEPRQIRAPLPRGGPAWQDAHVQNPRPCGPPRAAPPRPAKDP